MMHQGESALPKQSANSRGKCSGGAAGRSVVANEQSIRRAEQSAVPTPRGLRGTPEE
jgi:hypothetical protein